MLLIGGALGGDGEGGVLGKACGERTERFVFGRATGPGARAQRGRTRLESGIKQADPGRHHPVAPVPAGRQEEAELLPDRW